MCILACFVKAIKAFFDGRDIGPGADRLIEVRVVTINEFECGLASPFVALGIECEFSSEEEIGPIILLVIAEDTKVRFDVLVFALNFSVTFRVVGSC